MSSISITEVNDLDIVVEERVEFDNSKKQEYLNLFQKKIKDGIIKKNANFNDSATRCNMKSIA